MKRQTHNETGSINDNELSCDEGAMVRSMHSIVLRDNEEVSPPINQSMDILLLLLLRVVMWI